MNELVAASALDLARRIRGREVSSLEVVQTHLDHLAAVNPRVNALVQIMAEQALSAALVLEHAFGGWLPPQL
jgi:Asp-tRNA(Asn)/Glu-tRNA(Gln) amidotransferase A subunit family amidase